MIEVYLLNLTSQLEKPVEKFLHYFTARRQEKILRYKFTADRNRTVWAELLARSIIAKKMSRPIEEIQIGRDENGKPYVLNSALQISLSHSENWAACSVGEVASGIDVEEDSRDELALAEIFFTTREYHQLCKLNGRARSEKFLSIWTLKESFAKLTGDKLDDVLRVDSVDILSGRNLIFGKNFFVDRAVVGVCTEYSALPECFICIPSTRNLVCAV
ncbi:MAG: 4'-phosphopantetheinyl transferase superfamily protein [Selenomonadaceae bacterium]|nr:4'-phosphopantetheinyl transferase superfamily protein [Selenomonadaceae bacterium]